MNDNYGKVTERNLKNEIEESFLDYAMSVLLSRAIPDIRDGLKPVQRRILYCMLDDKMTPDRPTEKCAAIVGDTMKRFHPQGSAGIYGALVRMAQYWNMRYPLIIPQGNFGDPASTSSESGFAAERYTEAKLSEIALELLKDIEKDTVIWESTYNDKEKEPLFLSGPFPNLLANGANGIAVGWTTNIPPHNLNELIDAALMLLSNPESTVMDLMYYVKGPDFPTGGLLMKDGLFDMYRTGKGTFTLRGKTHFETNTHNKNLIIVDEFPYQVSRDKFIENVAQLVNEHKIDGISDIIDESDSKDMVRVVITLKDSVESNIILHNLYQKTSLQNTYSVLMLTVVEGRPQIISLKEYLGWYLLDRKRIVLKRTEYELRKREDRIHLLEGFMKIIPEINTVVDIIKENSTEDSGVQALIEYFQISEIQARAVMNFRLGRLTRLELGKTEQEYISLMKERDEFLQIIQSTEVLNQTIRQELQELKYNCGDSRKTTICDEIQEIEMEQLLEDKKVLLSLTNRGYIKSVDLNEYTTQLKGGIGISGVHLIDEDDFLREAQLVDLRSQIYFFSTLGKMYVLPAWKIPQSSRTAKGDAIINLLHLHNNEKITTFVQSNPEDEYIIILTKNGFLKKIPQKEELRNDGLKIISLQEGDTILNVLSTKEDDNIVVIGTARGKILKLFADDIPVRTRESKGSKGLNLENDYVVSMKLFRNEEAYIGFFTKQGYMKISLLRNYSFKKRKGSPVKALTLHNVKDELSDIIPIYDFNKEMLICSQRGQIIQLSLEEFSLRGKRAKGSTIMKIKENDEGSLIIGLVPYSLQSIAVVGDSNLDDI